MKEQDTVVDIIVLQEGDNPNFRAYMNFDEAIRIQNEGGLSCAEQVLLRETEDRPIPDSLKDGMSCITDIWVKLEPNVEVNLN